MVHFYVSAMPGLTQKCIVEFFCSKFSKVARSWKLAVFLPRSYLEKLTKSLVLCLIFLLSDFCAMRMKEKRILLYLLTHTLVDYNYIVCRGLVVEVDHSGQNSAKRSIFSLLNVRQNSKLQILTTRRLSVGLVSKYSSQ